MSEVTFTYGSKTDAEIKLVLSAVVFICLLRKGRIWQLPQPCTPTKLFEFIVAELPDWRRWLKAAGLSESDVEFHEIQLQAQEKEISHARSRS